MNRLPEAVEEQSKMSTTNPFLNHPILNSPYETPRRHWELDPEGQPTQKVMAQRRRAEFITPIPKPKKRKAAQADLVFDEGRGLSNAEQQYDVTSIIDEVREQVSQWRNLPPSAWQVTPETARLLKYWRHHEFSGVRPFFCQVEAVETAIWLTEVAPQSKIGKRFLMHLDLANRDANPLLSRLALKLATGAGKTTVMAMIIGWQTVNAVRRPRGEIRAHLLGRQRIRGTVVETRQAGDGGQIALVGPRGEATHLHGGNHLGAQGRHRVCPLRETPIGSSRVSMTRLGAANERGCG